MKTYELKLTSALVIAGQVVRAGTKVEVDEATAKDFLRRGKAELLGAPVAADEDPADSDQVDLAKMSKAELVEIATAMNIEGADKLNKAELVEAIQAADKEAE